MKYGAGIYGSQRMNPNNFVDALTSPLDPPEGQSSHLSSEISQRLCVGSAQNIFKGIHGSQRMYLNDFGDALISTIRLTFPVLR